MFYWNYQDTLLIKRMLEVVMKKEMVFHTMDVEEVIRSLHSSPEGLAESEVKKRMDEYGPNELEEGNKRSLLMMFLEQFKDFMVIVLIVAAVISTTARELADAAIILFVVILNAVLGVIQENKAEKALAALKRCLLLM